MRTIRLLQLNAWELRLYKNIKELIKSQQPDIICFQEVYESEYEIGIFPSLSEVRQDLNYPHAALAPFYKLKFMDHALEFGNAILTKEPIVSQNVLYTSGQYIADFRSFEKDDYNVRNLQHVVLNVDDEKLHVLNHHGHHVEAHKNGNQATFDACQKIAEYIDTLEGAVILTGDFNLVPTSDSLAVLNSRLRNLSIEYGLTTTRNNLTDKTEVCDYIFVNDQVKVENFFMADDVVSDHNALVVDFKVVN